MENYYQGNSSCNKRNQNGLRELGEGVEGFAQQ